MKIIISHDIDHLTAFEHKNLLIPKAIARSLIELFKGVISFKEFALRNKRIFIDNKWQNLEEIMIFNKDNNIPASFFIGTNNGIGLEYPLDVALSWAKIISDNGFDVGVHGISYQDKDDIQQEYNHLYNHLSKNIGIRMHYLRNDEQTLKNLSEVGYIYDSTILEDKNPYKIGNIWEFPMHIMEGNIFYQDGKRYTSKTLEEYKEITIKRIKELEVKNINYMTLLFHDRYFDDSFKIWKEWYIWVINYLKENNYQVISFKEAIKELENDSKAN